MACNTSESEHWFLLAVLPNNKSVVVLDSMPGDDIKPTAHNALSKICSLLKEIDSNIDLGQWRFIANKKGDVPQQSNDYDCGVFACLYARCLVGYSEMISETSISDFRKLMLLELHESKLHPVPPEGIQPERYYAVEYVENCYIGQALNQADGF